MYAFIKGRVEEKSTDYIVVDVNGIGYHIYTTGATLEKIKNSGEIIKFYTHLYVREDAVSLFGFITKEEKRMFEKLISVSGIGPKGAIGILSALSTPELALAIVTGDISLLVKAPGIGKKTAQRLVLELKEKIDNEQLIRTTETVSDVSNIAQEAIHALIALGYAAGEAAKAVDSVNISSDKVEEIVLAALKSLDKLRK